MERHLNNADAPPQSRYRGLTLPKLRFGRVKLGGAQREVCAPKVFTTFATSKSTLFAWIEF